MMLSADGWTWPRRETGPIWSDMEKDMTLMKTTLGIGASLACALTMAATGAHAQDGMEKRFGAAAFAAAG